MPHRLGIYTTALFLTQILAAKFVPPLNEVAFAAYSRIQARPEMIQSAFLKSVRLIMLARLAFLFRAGMVTAEPLVAVVLGPQWPRRRCHKEKRREERRGEKRSEVVPPLNEVAFAAYSRIQDQQDTIRTAFLKSVRLIMLVVLPFYFGLAVTAEPFVLAVLGPKWAETVPLVPILAMAMPLMTLQILFAPATNALGRPGLAVRTGLVGALLMPLAFLAGIQWGVLGLAWAWLGGMAVLLAATVELSLPVIGVGRRALLGAVAPGFAASAVMAGIVWAADALLPPLGRGPRLAVLVGIGMAAYAGLLFVFARRSSTRCWRWSGRARRSDALNVAQHRRRVGLDLVHPIFDQIADRDDADDRAALDHRQMADAPPGHQRKRAHDLGLGLDGDRRRGHDPLDRPVEHRGAVAPQAIDDVALGHDPGDLAAVAPPAARRSCARRAGRRRRAPACRRRWSALRGP